MSKDIKTNQNNADVPEKASRHIWILIVYIAVCTAIILQTAFFLHKYKIYISLIFYSVTGVVLVAGIVFFVLRKSSFFKLLFTTIIFAEIIFLIYIIMSLSGLFDTFTDINQVQALILSTGNWGRLIFCLIQLLQVVVLPVPAFIFYLVGIALYGKHITFLLSTMSVILGSIICFAIGRFAGEKVVNWIVGKDDAQKYRKYLGEKGKLLLIFMLVFPFFPDDIICTVAGLTTMSWTFFIITVIITRTINVATTCYTVGGIPFHGWGLVVWGAIIVGIVIVFWIINKKKERIIDVLSFNKKKEKPKEPVVYNINPAIGKLSETVQTSPEKKD